jgi:uncharacterized protein YjiS (DUF1127 family)
MAMAIDILVQGDEIVKQCEVDVDTAIKEYNAAMRELWEKHRDRVHALRGKRDRALRDLPLSEGDILELLSKWPPV